MSPVSLFGWIVALGAALPFGGACLEDRGAPGAQEGDEAWVEVPFDSDRWAREGVVSRLTEHLGRSCLLLESGMLWLPDADFRNGEIRFDISCSGRRGYVGATWRIQDPSNLEHFYLRPHQSGQPDSCQYTPVDHGCSAWQLFPECAAAIDYGLEHWIGVRLVVWEDRLAVHVDSDEPRFVARLRREPMAGGLGLLVPGFEPAHFSRFRYRELPEAPPMVVPGVQSPPGTVATWNVSSAFPWTTLDGQQRVPEALLSGLSWSPIDAEPGGVTNLARLQGIEGAADTCLARLRLDASGERVVSIDFGFSDRVKVYHDARLVYEGDDSYLSRDHRFLGTIGLHDRLTLQLHGGRNDILFAVSESFGGWGVIAAVEPTPGVRSE